MENNVFWPGWETVQLIGRGSFGAVYEIQRDVLGDVEKAALKVISIPQSSSDIEELYNDGYDDESITSAFQSHLKSIVAEYTLMRKMNGSSNIVNCDDIRYVQHDDGIGWDIFIKMELLTPLAKALPPEISEETVIRIGEDLCSALEVCKKFDIVHRDIKPQNIFVSDLGDYKLGDFGIAKTMERTMGGTKIGTYKYMAPEVYNNKPYGSAADIYSLGLVLYWLLNERRLPFLPLPPAKMKAGMEEEGRYRRLSGEPLPAPAHGSDALKKIVLKACAYEPKDRFASAAEMHEALRQLSGNDAPVPAPVPESKPAPAPQPESKPEMEPAPSVEKKKKRWPILVAACLALCIIGGGLGVWLSQRDPTADGTPQSSQPSQKPTPSQPMEETTPPEKGSWSGWVSELPAGVTADKYEIEERTLYSSQTLETKTTTELNDADLKDGWEVVKTSEAVVGETKWTEFSEEKVTPSETREVKTEKRYKYSDKETTTSSSPTKTGWILYDTTSSWKESGNWSDWQTTRKSYRNDRAKEEAGMQYRYQDISYTTKYTWSAPSPWQNEKVYETEDIKVETQEAYHYYYYVCSNCGKQLPGQNVCYSWDGGCGRSYAGGSYKAIRLATPYSETLDFGGTGVRYTTVNGEKVFAYTSSSSQYYVAPITQYRYQTRSATQEVHYGTKSDWSFTPYSSSSTRNVETRTVYRYMDFVEVKTYHFYRWTDFTDWSPNEVYETSSRQVKETLFYSYQDKIIETTYFLERWSKWSVYSESVVTPSETVRVKTETQYQYKPKSN